MQNFYEKNHKKYFESTVNIEPAAFLEPLTKLLDPGATILDIGCGSGRDLLWFADHGFQPTGFEQSPGLASLARKHSLQPVIEGDFSRHDFSSFQFDALVCIGSFVHLSKWSLPTILKSVGQALSVTGLILLTLKEGHDHVRSDDGRVFTLWSCKELELLFMSIGFEVIDFSRQISKLRSDDIWLSYVLRQVNGE